MEKIVNQRSDVNDRIPGFKAMHAAADASRRQGLLEQVPQPVLDAFAASEPVGIDGYGNVVITNPLAPAILMQLSTDPIIDSQDAAQQIAAAHGLQADLPRAGIDNYTVLPYKYWPDHSALTHRFTAKNIVTDYIRPMPSVVSISPAVVSQSGRTHVGLHEIAHINYLLDQLAVRSSEVFDDLMGASIAEKDAYLRVNLPIARAQAAVTVNGHVGQLTAELTDKFDGSPASPKSVADYIRLYSERITVGSIAVAAIQCQVLQNYYGTTTTTVDLNEWSAHKHLKLA